MKVLISFIAFVILLSVASTLARNYDELLSHRTWKKLAKAQTSAPLDRFDKDMVSELPPPARKYFEYMILPGTPLKTTASIEMRGQLGLGPKAAPDYMDMSASQILAFPEGFIWRVKSGRGPMVLTGFDGLHKDASWARFWLMHAMPVGRAGGRSKQQKDHRRAAFGRLVAEAAIWTPAALLPSEMVSWSAIDANTAEVTAEYDGLTQTIEIHITENGRPLMVTLQRWTDANPTNTYQLQPFGGYLSAFKEYDGFYLPTHVEAGHFIGTDQYYPFYIADIQKIAFED